MVQRRDEHDVVGKELAVLQGVLRVGILHPEHELHLVVEQELHPLAQQAAPHPQPYPGVLIPKSLDVGRQDERRSGHAGGKLQTPRDGVVDTLHEVDGQCVHPLDQMLGEFVERLAG